MYKYQELENEVRYDGMQIMNDLYSLRNKLELHKLKIVTNKHFETVLLGHIRDAIWCMEEIVGEHFLDEHFLDRTR